MENETDKVIQDQFDSLPLDVKEAIGRVPWKARLRDIAKREGLKAEQADTLETETMLILYGFLEPDTYLSSLTSQVGVGEEQAERISELVANEIITDIEKQFEMIDALAPKDTTPKMAGPAPVASTPQQEAPKSILEIPPEILAKQVFLPEVAPDMLPEVLPNEVAHDVPHVEPAPIIEKAPAPVVMPAVQNEKPKSMIEEKLAQVTSAAPQTPRQDPYPKGIDPYREPVN
ncbi:MAG: hypothetical protein JWN50_241 [Parcubacteria group bacterium]|nr:hypothetical protein [Parcubacteria group bacterium]